jgi:Uma2 family endonuclease
MITDISQLDLGKQYSYADYLSWKFSERVELIKGWLYKMSPSPSRRHQMVASALYRMLYPVFEERGCESYHAPFDVRFINQQKSTEDKLVHTVVQPDFFVVCDTTKMDERGCLGAPNLCAEALSLGNSNHDLKRKFKLYEENGVQEYWILYTNDELIMVYDLVNGKYQKRDSYEAGEKITGGILLDYEVDVSKIFAQPK